jgi:hypothetical protein
MNTVPFNLVVYSLFRWLVKPKKDTTALSEIKITASPIGAGARKRTKTPQLSLSYLYMVHNTQI